MLSVCFILLYVSESKSYGYDSSPDQGACKRYRSSRLLQPPCDLAVNTFCTTAGTMYPWHAVRRFVRENQGLMRRMYGDQQHITVLRNEMESNEVDSSPYYSHSDSDLYINGDFKSRYAKDVEFDNELHQNDENTPRLLQDESKMDDILNTKFIYSEEPTKSFKLSDLRTVPQIRTTTQKTIEPTTVTSTTSAKLTDDNTTEIFYEIFENQTVTENTTDKTTITTTTTESTTDTTTSFEETTTDGANKEETIGTVLFQDVVSQKKKPHPSMNYKTQGVNACPIEQEVVAPFWANNTRGDLLTLLNIYPYEQYVHVERCTNEHRQMYCRDGCKCEQKYHLHRLLAFDPSNECKGIFSDWFKFPSGCACKCYDIPEFRMTSRSPRNKDEKYVPNWFKKKSKICKCCTEKAELVGFSNNDTELKETFNPICKYIDY